MRFVDPTFLWAYLVLLIPLLIHLIHFRRFRRVAFSDLSMLKQIEIRSKRSRRLRKWLILAARMLALAALVTAFAQPYLPGDSQRKHSARTWLQLDNSFSMQLVGDQGSMLEQGKSMARELIKASSSQERFRIYTNSGPTGGWLDRSEAIAQIDGIRIEPAPNDYKQMLQDRADEGEPMGRAVIISDFQTPLTAEPEVFDSIGDVYLLRLQPQVVRNLSIDSVWLIDPVVGTGQPIRLGFQVANHGDQDVEAASVRLVVNGRQEGAQSVDISAEGSARSEFSYTSRSTGWETATLELDDPVAPFDNTYHFSLDVAVSHKVLVVCDGTSSLQRIFANDPAFDLRVRKSAELDLADIDDQDLVVLEGVSDLGTATVDQLRERIQKGMPLFYVPPSTDPGGLAESLGGWRLGAPSDKGVQVDPGSLQHPFYAGVFSSIPDRVELPRIQTIYSSSMDLGSVILRLKDDSPLLGQRSIGRGRLYQLQVSLAPDWSDLAQHELWVVTVLRSLLSSQPVDELAYFLDRSTPIELSGTYREQALELSNGRSTVIVDKGFDQGQLRFWLNPLLSEAGNYQLKFQGTEEALRPLALNHSRRESVNNYLDAAGLERMFGADAQQKSAGDEQLALSIVQSSEGIALWKHFVVLCLIFILLEILLLRFSKS